MTQKIDGLVLRAATVEEHATLAKIAKTSPYTRDFTNTVMFSSEQAYEKGWIRVAELDGQIVGFTCVRHKKRFPETALYFIQIIESHRSRGIGEIMLQDIVDNAPTKTIRLNVMRDNEGARRFYERLGFTVAGYSIGGEALSMVREYP